jgi:hypothetical protein
MGEITEITQLMAGMPLWTLIALIMLGAFGLAAYAIHAVLSSTNRRDGSE